MDSFYSISDELCGARKIHSQRAISPRFRPTSGRFRGSFSQDASFLILPLPVLQGILLPHRHLYAFKLVHKRAGTLNGLGINPFSALALRNVTESTLVPARCLHRRHFRTYDVHEVFKVFDKRIVYRLRWDQDWSVTVQNTARWTRSAVRGDCSREEKHIQHHLHFITGPLLTSLYVINRWLSAFDGDQVWFTCNDDPGRHRVSNFVRTLEKNASARIHPLLA